ncbi:MAG: geranylgeranylglyceryl/heptaprenylglyceryl phosphate synthase [Candidatus Neomarinimicrobiota bacterium]
MKQAIYKYLQDVRSEKGAAYVVLIDPDRKNDGIIEERVAQINESGVDAIFVGGSLIMDSHCQERVRRIKEQARVPVIFFPGGLSQLSPHFDAILFMSILSGRNPHYLIGEQVLAAPIVRDLGIEVIPTGYLLFNGGGSSAVEFMSNTIPIPLNRPDIALAHALAAQYLGMRLVYLEAGSGAKNPIPTETVRLVAGELEIPAVVGGGIRTPEAARQRVEAGAAIVVTGTVTEEQTDGSLMRELATAVHYKI